MRNNKQKEMKHKQVLHQAEKRPDEEGNGGEGEENAACKKANEAEEATAAEGAGDNEAEESKGQSNYHPQRRNNPHNYPHNTHT
jgi:hypothetical protein